MQARNTLKYTILVMLIAAGSVTADSPIYRTLYGSDQQLVLMGRLTAPMGYQQINEAGDHRFHSGIDIAAPRNTPIFAPADGQVVSAGDRGNYGKVVRLLSDGNTITMFAHLESFVVQEGQKVEAGDIIGRVGTSGSSTRPHVHIETWVDGERQDPVEVWQLSMNAWR